MAALTRDANRANQIAASDQVLASAERLVRQGRAVEALPLVWTSSNLLEYGVNREPADSREFWLRAAEVAESAGALEDASRYRSYR